MRENLVTHVLFPRVENNIQVQCREARPLTPGAARRPRDAAGCPAHCRLVTASLVTEAGTVIRSPADRPGSTEHSKKKCNTKPSFGV